MTTAVSAGNLIAQKYSKLGFSNLRMVPPLTKTLMLVVGMPNVGKSHLFQSCPEAFIFNTDLSSTVTKDGVKATIWPGVHPIDGSTIEPDGREQQADFEKNTGFRRTELTWDRILEIKDDLVGMARNNDPSRPGIIVMDTLNRAIRLVQEHVARFAKSVYRIADGDGLKWKELYGPAAWDAVYTTLAEFPQDFRKAGYGFAYVMHLTQQYVQVGENQHKRDVNVCITNNFWSRLFPMFEIVAAVEQEIVTVDVVQKIKVPGGGIAERKVKDTKSVRVLTVDPSASPELQGIVKHRIKMDGKLELPEDAWAAFADKYKTAAQLN